MDIRQQARVLIIDNDVRVVEQLQPLLEKRGFCVASTGYDKTEDESSETGWIDAIVGFARKFRPHVVIVDLRLRNDYMDEESGLIIIPQLDAAYNILYSARLTFDVVDRANEQGVYKCIAKGAGGTKKILDALKDASEQGSAQYAGVNIQWPPKWSGESVVRAICKDAPIDMADDLIFQLYKGDANNAEILDVMGQEVSPPLTSRRRSTVVKVRPPSREPSILKLASAKRIRAEQQNYSEHVEGQMRGAFHTQLVASTLFWDMGGLIYSLISGQNIMSFADHYARHTDAELIVLPLKHLFAEVWRSHYERQDECLEDTEYGTLYDLYDVMYKFDRIFGTPEKFDLIGWTDKPIVSSPLEWILANRESSRMAAARIAVTHGDLHSDNIFVNDEHAWVIDFERTGKGHILRDFVELEIDILTRLTSSQIDYRTFAEICKLLLSSNAFNMQAEPMPVPHDIPQSVKCEAKKSMDVIRNVRRIARELVVPFSMSEYRWALLLNALFVAYHSDMPKDPTPNQTTHLNRTMQQGRAFIFAQLICEHIESNNYDPTLRTRV